MSEMVITLFLVCFFYCVADIFVFVLFSVKHSHFHFRTWFIFFHRSLSISLKFFHSSKVVQFIIVYVFCGF